MLQITIPESEIWDENKQEFVYQKELTLQMEHSLLSLSKWESKYQKSFIHTKEKTEEEALDYIRFMTITQNVKPEVYYRLSAENLKQINDYIGNPMTATTFSDKQQAKGRREIITAEIIYNWMLSLGIPMDREKWHLNRLITLIRVSSIKNQPTKSPSKANLARDYAALNAQRRAQMKSRG